MALLISDIITDRVRVLLRDIDAGGVQWLDAELIAWINDACNEISRIRPESSSTTGAIPMVAGPKQNIPAGGDMLLEVICNETAGRAVRRIERHTLDNENPNWLNATATVEVFRYVASLTDPRTFYIYPPSTGVTHNLTIVYSAAPTPVTALGDTFPLPDMYAPVAVNYVCFRAFQKLTESPEAQQRASEYMQIFIGQMGQTDSTMEQRNSKVRQPSLPARV